VMPQCGRTFLPPSHSCCLCVPPQGLKLVNPAIHENKVWQGPLWGCQKGYVAPRQRIPGGPCGYVQRAKKPREVPDAAERALCTPPFHPSHQEPPGPDGRVKTAAAGAGPLAAAAARAASAEPGVVPAGPGVLPEIGRQPAPPSGLPRRRSLPAVAAAAAPGPELRRALAAGAAEERATAGAGAAAAAAGSARRKRSLSVGGAVAVPAVAAPRRKRATSAIAKRKRVPAAALRQRVAIAKQAAAAAAAAGPSGVEMFHNDCNCLPQNQGC
jgi:hypothetical protein